MRETGERFVCDRCKKEIFIADSSDEKVAECELPKSWGFHYINDREGLNHLCGDCHSTYVVMIADFMKRR